MVSFKIDSDAFIPNKFKQSYTKPERNIDFRSASKEVMVMVGGGGGGGGGVYFLFSVMTTRYLIWL